MWRVQVKASLISKIKESKQENSSQIMAQGFQQQVRMGITDKWKNLTIIVKYNCIAKKVIGVPVFH